MVSTNRPRTPSASSDDKGKSHPPQPRRTSLGGLLRRKSGDLKPSRKEAKLREAERKRQLAEIAKSPPRLPDLFNGQKLTAKPIGREDSVAIMSNRIRPSVYMDSGKVPIPPMPSANGSRNGGSTDLYARTESMTHRGRYSYASSAMSSTGINSPRRVRRRKDPTPFNILIIGAQSSGKSSFLNFLKTSLALPPKKSAAPRPSELHEDMFPVQNTRVGNFEPHYLETEIDGERIGLTLWDSEGLEKNIVDLQLREMSSFIESKFEETFSEEMKVVRAAGVQDTHIHCAFLLLDPVHLDRNIAALKKATLSSNGGGVHGKYQAPHRIIGGLDEDLDLQILRTLQGKTTVVPVISKADTITSAHMAHLKKTVWDSLRKANLDPLEALGLDDEGGEGISDSRIDEREEPEESDENRPYPTPEARTSSPNKRLSSGSVRRYKTEKAEESGEIPSLPLSIISPDIYEPGVIGRKFPWGFADPMNEEHCDFVRLKEAVFSEWRGELREASRELWYEGWRTSRLKHREASVPRLVSK